MCHFRVCLQNNIVPKQKKFSFAFLKTFVYNVHTDPQKKKKNQQHKTAVLFMPGQ